MFAQDPGFLGSRGFIILGGMIVLLLVGCAVAAYLFLRMQLKLNAAGDALEANDLETALHRFKEVAVIAFGSPAFTSQFDDAIEGVVSVYQGVGLAVNLEQLVMLHQQQMNCGLQGSELGRASKESKKRFEELIGQLPPPAAQT